MRVRIKPPYFGIKVFFKSGNGYWFNEVDGVISLVFSDDQAKPFLTQGSAERYIVKLKERHPVAASIFRYEVQELGN